MFANTGPRTKRKPRLPVATSSSMISVPVMSDGIRSGVNWMRENLSSSASATVCTISVFASPLTFVVAILLVGAAGWFLDGLLHTRPLLAIVGAFVGGFAGFMRIYYRVKADTAAKGGAANTAAKGGEGRRTGGEG